MLCLNPFCHNSCFSFCFWIKHWPEKCFFAKIFQCQSEVHPWPVDAITLALLLDICLKRNKKNMNSWAMTTNMNHHSGGGRCFALCQLINHNHRARLGRAQDKNPGREADLQAKICALPISTLPWILPHSSEWSGVGCSQRCCNMLLAHIKLM